jgi:NAD(P)-dependent dehydrogenase (short-subunit alcohol dehydrogenase family)
MMHRSRASGVTSDAVDSRVAIVTGASSGIGEATARLLGKQGVDVALVARRRDRIEAVAADIVEAGGLALPVPADLSDPRAPWRIVDAVLEARGRLDVVVNDAAALYIKQVEEFTLDQFDELVAVNLRAPYFLVQAALPALRKAPAPVVVNVSSAAAAMYRAGQTAYGLTKAGLEHMTMNLAAELAPDRIRVACVRPGPVRTEMHRAVPDPDERMRQLAKSVPLGRLGEPEEVARWIWHLVDADSAWVTGCVVTVDGGRVLGAPGT